MSFGDIPVRENGEDFLVSAEWFNSIKYELVAAFGTGGYIKVEADQLIASAGEVSFDPATFKPLFPISGNGGAVVASSTPFGTSHGFQSGKEIILLGLSDANTVTFEVNDIDEGFISNGKVVVGRFEQVIYIYNATLKRFIRKE